MNPNRHGLSRNIPDPVMRELRQACGYGCVICGCAIYQYEHVDPVFTEAKEHNPKRMALLCGSCHDKKTRGLLSKDTVMRARRSPVAKRKGFSSLSLDVAPDSMVAVKIGQTEFHGLRNILIVDNETILSVSPPESRGTPPRIDAAFYDRSNKLVARIVENEWRGELTAFDIETKGCMIKVRSKPRGIDLVLRVVPPHGIVLEQLRMCRNGKTIAGRTGQGFKVRTREAAVVIPPDPRVIERAPYWLSIQEDALWLGTDRVMRLTGNDLAGVWRIEGAELEEVDPIAVGIPPPPGSSSGHKVTRITKLTAQGKPAMMGAFFWKTPQGTLVPIWPERPCPCGSGKQFKDCCQPPGFFG